ncbi:MAG TPA: hypothetical protein VL360_02865 [Gammaproteobacteria bacterium]|jgi:uncharacterized membrane protein|nr:hypothetical protein [Gammaproteobacteria bacterium]
MDKKKIAGIIATAAAVAFITAPIATASHAAAKVKCYGVNSCKGKSACKTAKNECKGKNSCKGQGMKMMTEAKCTKKGGTTEEPTAN